MLPCLCVFVRSSPVSALLSSHQDTSSSGLKSFWRAHPHGLSQDPLCKYNPILKYCRVLFFFFFLFTAAPAAYEVPRLGVDLELELLADTTATAMPDLNHLCDLCCSSWQRQILNPPNEARDQTHNFMDISQVLNLLSHNGHSTGVVVTSNL